MRWIRIGRTAAAVLLGLGLLVPDRQVAVAAPSYVEAYPVTAARMRAAGAPYAGWAAAGRRFLAFDRGGGLAVEVLGDLAGAERIVVLVPGARTRLSDFDRGLGGVAGRAPARQGRALYHALRTTAPTARVAVLVWLGYPPPDSVAAAAGTAPARRGARALAAHLRTLADRRPTARVTLVGHSYGAVVVGLAARAAPPTVTDVVTLGGVGLGVDRATDLVPVRVWAAEATTDWIHRVPAVRLPGLGHGIRPGDPAFGARRLPTGGVAGHDGYLSEGGGTTAAVASVVLGGDPEVTR
ncbi:alpha/beta hydrolase [Micromonospora humi]|uniref:Alpha/beta hydrolase n=1 Tax=Micromonospora humi TaxID=745366 RepID=A0A1C5JGH3_9ACTN|nr:alpha/beta hydrolase [Micromonospora humi]SCG69136.1 Alpha/beta hydrolase [Micromonospora humi]